jgi:hypothetical protein
VRGKTAASYSPNDASSDTARGGLDSNHSAMAGFAAQVLGGGRCHLALLGVVSNITRCSNPPT